MGARSSLMPMALTWRGPPRRRREHAFGPAGTRYSNGHSHEAHQLCAETGETCRNPDSDLRRSYFFVGSQSKDRECKSEHLWRSVKPTDHKQQSNLNESRSEEHTSEL